MEINKMRRFPYMLLIITFFYTTSLAQPYIDESINHSKFKYSLHKINSSDNSTLKSIQEELAKSEFADTELRVYPTAFDTNSTLLLHLKKPAHILELSIIDMLGNVVSMPLKGELEKGFYEISVLSDTKTNGVFIARLITDGKTYSKYIIR